MSRRDSDSEKVPAALYDRLTDTPTYAARMYKVQFTYTAFGATIGANVVMYLATASIAAVRMSRARGGTIPGRP